MAHDHLNAGEYLHVHVSVVPVDHDHGDVAVLAAAAFAHEVQRSEIVWRSGAEARVVYPESTEGGRWVSLLKRQEGAPVLLG